MNAEDCLHDCTCHTCRDGAFMDPDAEPVGLDCDLPAGHAGPHWDPENGWFN